jgi:hypothetical protein
MTARKYIQIDIPSGTDPKTLLTVAKIVQNADDQLRSIGVQSCRTSFHCDFDGTRRLTVLGSRDATRVAKQLFEAGRWFEVAPLDDECFEFTVKNEPLPAHLSELFSPALDLVAEIERLQQ